MRRTCIPEYKLKNTSDPQGWRTDSYDQSPSRVKSMTPPICAAGRRRGECSLFTSPWVKSMTCPPEVCRSSLTPLERDRSLSTPSFAARWGIGGLASAPELAGGASPAGMVLARLPLDPDSCDWVERRLRSEAGGAGTSSPCGMIPSACRNSAKRLVKQEQY